MLIMGALVTLLVFWMLLGDGGPKRAHREKLRENSDTRHASPPPGERKSTSDSVSSSLEVPKGTPTSAEKLKLEERVSTRDQETIKRMHLKPFKSSPKFSKDSLPNTDIREWNQKEEKEKRAALMKA